MKKIIIEDKIFEVFPDFRRGLVIVEDIDNATENKVINDLLNNAIREKAGLDYKNLPQITAWDDAHRKFGSNPNNFPPSIKSLVERVVKGKKIPFINSVVAAFNYISIKYLLPAGGDDVDLVKGDLVVGFARGNEKFRGIGATEDDNPKVGEVIYFDSSSRSVMCRRWNWRNGDFAKITEKSKKIVLNVEGIGPITEEIVKKARDEMAEILNNNCAAVVTVDYLDSNKREIELPGKFQE